MRQPLRKIRAKKLLKLLEQGPVFDGFEKFQENYQLWVRTWILGEVEDLIPELRKIKKAREEKLEREGGS